MGFSLIGQCKTGWASRSFCAHLVHTRFAPCFVACSTLGNPQWILGLLLLPSHGEGLSLLTDFTSILILDAFWSQVSQTLVFLWTLMFLYTVYFLSHIAYT